jgi:hypothetical protein
VVTKVSARELGLSIKIRDQDSLLVSCYTEQALSLGDGIPITPYRWGNTASTWLHHWQWCLKKDFSANASEFRNPLTFQTSSPNNYRTFSTKIWQRLAFWL